jgi:hypothetical protein
MEECKLHGRILNAYEILAETLQITHHLGGSGVDIENEKTALNQIQHESWTASSYVSRGTSDRLF